MNQRQRKAKKAKAQEHTASAYKNLSEAMQRTKEAMEQFGISFRDGMEREGYVPDGQGGWRRKDTRNKAKEVPGRAVGKG